MTDPHPTDSALTPDLPKLRSHPPPQPPSESAVDPVHATLEAEIGEDTPLKLPSSPHLTYEQRRQQMKFGYWQSAVIIFQSTVGITWFTLHQPLAKVGLYLGAIITLVAGYVTAYGLLLLDETATLAEIELDRTTRMKNCEELCNVIPASHIPVGKWTMMIASLAMIFASSISNVCMMADTIEHYYQVPGVWTKLATFAVISVFLVLIIEPEGIEMYTYITTTCLVVLGTISFPTTFPSSSPSIRTHSPQVSHMCAKTASSTTTVAECLGTTSRSSI